jgi:enoyl-CoA hydratase/carnithine racemase
MEERDYQSLLVQQDGHIVTLTFNKPEKKNPLSQEVINELLWALDDAEAADDVRVIILTGAGNAFSAGADLKGMNADRGTLEKKGEFDDLMLRFDTLKKPIVARIPGYVMGGAMGIIACCHFAIACESAILGTPEIKRGLFPMMIMAVLDEGARDRFADRGCAGRPARCTCRGACRAARQAVAQRHADGAQRLQRAAQDVGRRGPSLPA